MKAPASCDSMSDVRVAIDALDRELVALHVRRLAYVGRAAEIKHAQDMPAFVPERVEEVIANVRRLAESSSADPDFFEALWRTLVGLSITYEQKLMDQNRLEVDRITSTGTK
jgi:isochorismate pyruvate lyase